MRAITVAWITVALLAGCSGAGKTPVARVPATQAAGAVDVPLYFEGENGPERGIRLGISELEKGEFVVRKGQDLKLRIFLGNDQEDDIFVRCDEVVIGSVLQFTDDPAFTYPQGTYPGLAKWATYRLLSSQPAESRERRVFEVESFTWISTTIPLAERLAGSAPGRAKLTLSFVVTFYRRSTGQCCRASGDRVIPIRYEP